MLVYGVCSVPQTAAQRARERMRESSVRAAKHLVREMQEKIRGMREMPEEEADYTYMSRIMRTNGMKVAADTENTRWWRWW